MQVQIYCSRISSPCSSSGNGRFTYRRSTRPVVIVQAQLLQPRATKETSTSFPSGPTLIQEKIKRSDPDSEDEVSGENLPLVRRPAKDLVLEKAEEIGEEKDEEEETPSSSSSSGIDSGLNDFAKKMPMFEPLERVEAGRDGTPLPVNLELWLYRAKVQTRNFQFDDAERILRKVV